MWILFGFSCWEFAQLWICNFMSGAEFGEFFFLSPNISNTPMFFLLSWDLNDINDGSCYHPTAPKGSNFFSSLLRLSKFYWSVLSFTDSILVISMLLCSPSSEGFCIYLYLFLNFGYCASEFYHFGFLKYLVFLCRYFLCFHVFQENV